MADLQSTADQWLDAQRRYWDAWMDMARRGMEAASPAPRKPANPWADAVEQWWHTVAPTTPRPAHNLFEQMVNLGKSYFSMAESMGKGGALDDPNQVVETWGRMMSDAFAQSSKGFNPFAPQTSGFGGMSAQGMPPFWEMPFAEMTKNLPGMNLSGMNWPGMNLPTDFWQGMQGMPGMQAFKMPQVGSGDIRAQMERMLSAPTLGYSRESQEQYQEYVKLLMEYEKSSRDYQAGFAELGQKSMESFRKLLETKTKDTGPLTSIRAVYNLWVDACEEVYADYALSDTYAKRYGQMVNDLMAVKQQGAVLLDQWLESMNMPTRRDLTSTQRRLHDTRSEMHRLRSEMRDLQQHVADIGVSPDEFSDLRSEIAALRKLLKDSTGAEVETSSIKIESAPTESSAQPAAAVASSDRSTTKPASTPRKTSPTTPRRKKT